MRFPKELPRSKVLFYLSGVGGEVEFRFGPRFCPVVFHFEAGGAEFTAYVTVSRVDIPHRMLDFSRSLRILARSRGFEDFVSFIARDARI